MTELYMMSTHAVLFPADRKKNSHKMLTMLLLLYFLFMALLLGIWPWLNPTFISI